MPNFYSVALHRGGTKSEMAMHLMLSVPEGTSPIQIVDEYARIGITVDWMIRVPPCE